MRVAEISLAFSRPWTFRVPFLTRQLQAKYVDAFFADGTLRLSSFDVFRKHPDKLRRDEQEGRIHMEITGPNSRTAVVAINGQEAYVMCASTIETALPTDGSMSAFRILDTLGFANAISAQIPGFLGGTEGLCSYRDNTMLRKADPRPFESPPEGEDVEKWFEEHDRRIGKHSIDAFFVKESRFSHEAEYRFIWFASGQHRDYIDIECPAARQFCERV
jgi:hypothetical protein